MPPNHLILCHPLFLLPSVFPSIGVFSNESVLHVRWPKYWSFSFRISPSNDNSGVISFRIDWFDLLAVQGSLKSTYILQRYKYTYITCTDSFLHKEGGAVQMSGCCSMNQRSACCLTFYENSLMSVSLFRFVYGYFPTLCLFIYTLWSCLLCYYIF